MQFEEHTMPAGLYFIGDPCYVIQDGGNNQDGWIDYLHASGMLVHEGKHSTSFHFRDMLHFTAPTKYGDGEYFDQHGGVYGVDSGMIGVTLITNEEQIPQQARDLGRVVDMSDGFTIAWNDGKFIIGPYAIDTDFDEEGIEGIHE